MASLSTQTLKIALKSIELTQYSGKDVEVVAEAKTEIKAFLTELDELEKKATLGVVGKAEHD